jgi:hypothetical protein
MGQAKRRKKTDPNYGTKSNVAVLEPLKTKLPHYDAETVVALFHNNDPRIRMNDYGTSQCIVLSDVPGYFKYSDDNGGTATFYRGDNDTPVFTAAREITDALRAAKHDNEDCTCKWYEFTYRCGCEEHHEGEIYDVTPRIEVCNTTECDGKHAHLLGLCSECFAIEQFARKAEKDITADNIRIQLR